jgi:Protein of unknown function (DUF2585)
MSDSSESLLPHRGALILAFLIAVYGIAILFAMGRPPICECGVVRLWTGAVNSPENSQQIADWYTLSHIIHGMIFYAGAHWLWRRWKLFDGAPARWAFPIAVALEASWELLENSPLIIDRYRSVTANFGYSGDSIINSAFDIVWMSLGFWIAARLPWKATLAIAVVFELIALAVIRDNLTLNVVMLVWPLDAIRDWQGTVA